MLKALVGLLTSDLLAFKLIDTVYFQKQAVHELLEQAVPRSKTFNIQKYASIENNLKQRQCS